MKNKKFRVPLIIFGFAIFIWATCSTTKIFTSYKATSGSCYPAIKNNERFFVSALVKPKRLNFICFYTNTQEWGRIMRVCRLCGLGGDTVQIKNGILYVNGKNIDAGLDIANDYMVTIDVYEKYKDNILAEEEMINPMSPFQVDIRNGIVDSLKIPAQKLTYPVDSLVDMMSKDITNNINPDHCGPFVVPKNTFFVLGDNRHSAQDSRYIGFIPERDFAATVLFK